jgi:hypothetical protein
MTRTIGLERRTRRAIAAVVAIVGIEAGVPAERIMSRERDEGLAVLRQLAMWVAYRWLEVSTPSIGKAMGRHHSTVLYGMAEIQERMDGEGTATELRARVWERLEGIVPEPPAAIGAIKWGRRGRPYDLADRLERAVRALRGEPEPARTRLLVRPPPPRAPARPAAPAPDRDLGVAVDFYGDRRASAAALEAQNERFRAAMLAAGYEETRDAG